MAFVRSLDPKLVATLVSLAITRLAVELLGVAESDPLLQAGIALAVASVAGWLTPNAGTVLRTEHEGGNPDPSKLQAGYALVELLVGAILLLVFIWLVFALVD